MGGTEMRRSRTVAAALAVVVLAATPRVGLAQEEHGESAHGLSEEHVPLQKEAQPERPRLLVELGEKFLATGPMSEGIELPTGAVWRPALWVFGNYRSAVQSFDGAAGGPSAGGSVTNSEWANRLDVFANLRLSGTERVLVGFRPLDETGGVGYNFGDDPGDDGWQDDFNDRVETLFFEGDFGELFPFLDDDDSGALDYGFAVGRQPINFQDGVLIADNMDAVGITRNSLRPSGTSNVRITGLFGWGGIHRNNVEDPSAKLVGLFTAVDLPWSTIRLDGAYTFADDPTGDGVYGGVAAVQRIGAFHRIFNTAFRVNVSVPVDGETSAVTRGALLLSEISWTPHGNHNLFYVNNFWAIGSFSPAARELGGPLGRAGILFQAPGMGRYGAPLGARPTDAVGGAVGHQAFFSHHRRQLIVEVAGYEDTDGRSAGTAGIGARLQQAVGRRFILRLDGFAAIRETGGDPLGIRAETRIKF